MATCRSCGEEIFFVTLPSGKLIPLDPAPDPIEGNVGVIGSRGDVLTDRQATAARAMDIRLYRSHFATCPNAAEHRRS